MRSAGVTRGAFAFSTVDALAATLAHWAMAPAVKAAFLTTCLFDSVEKYDDASGAPVPPDPDLLDEARSLGGEHALSDDDRHALATAIDAVESAWAAAAAAGKPAEDDEEDAAKENKEQQQAA